MRTLSTLSALLLSVCSVMAQSPAATLAPTGTLRGVFLGTNPVHGRVDPQTGKAVGPVPDLVEEVARILGVRASIVGAPDAAAVIAALRSGSADIGFLAYDETRAREVDYGAAFVVMHNSYLVRSGSTLQKSADVDREGVTVAAVKGQTPELFVSRHLRRARVRVLDAMPPQAEVERLLTSGEVDAFAVNQQRALDGQSASNGRLRPLADTFLEVDQCVVVAKGGEARLKVINPLIAKLRADGFTAQSIARAKLAGVSVPTRP